MMPDLLLGYQGEPLVLPVLRNSSFGLEPAG